MAVKGSRSAATSAKPHAPHRFTGDLPEAQNYGSRESIRALSLPGGPQAGQSRGPVLGKSYHGHPAAKGFLYLVVFVDLFSRNILSWKLSNSLDTEFCLYALEMALVGDREPWIFYSDHGCQFTSGDFVARLQVEEIKISWSGRKRCYEVNLVERMWRTVKYEVVYLHAYSNG